MKLWGGRFAKETNEMVDEFNACIGFGSRLYEQDILGSIAHATMLGEQNIIPQEDAAKIVEGLKGILADAKAGKIQWSTEAEDIHMNVFRLGGPLNFTRLRVGKNPLEPLDDLRCVLLRDDVLLAEHGGMGNGAQNILFI